METLESLHTKLGSAADVEAVVKTMKAVAAANIVQYEQSVTALADYHRAVSLGLAAYLGNGQTDRVAGFGKASQPAHTSSVVLVFGSEQGLVGRFNDTMADFVRDALEGMQGSVELWAVGERIHSLLEDSPFATARLFAVPRAVDAITPLVNEILVNVQEATEKTGPKALYVFYNHPQSGIGYAPFMQRVLPLDDEWRKAFEETIWPTRQRPQVLGRAEPAATALVREYLFVLLFKACAESLTSENASRLNAMQRAEKNIGEIIVNLTKSYHRLRQSSIDAELFDLVAGFDSLPKT